MKSLIFSLVILASGAASATELKCIQTEELKIEGMPFYIFYDISIDSDDPTKISEVRFQSLADNGFYSEWSLELASGGFYDHSHVAFETIADGQGVSLYAKYNATTDNYIGSLFFEDSTEVLGMKCMKLKAL